VIRQSALGGPRTANNAPNPKYTISKDCKNSNTERQNLIERDNFGIPIAIVP